MSHARQQRTSPAKLGPRPPPGPLVRTARKRVLYSQHLAQSFSRPNTPTIAFSETCALFHPRRIFNASVSNQFHTLSALFCRCSQINSFVFMRSRTLCEKHRGGGGGESRPGAKVRLRAEVPGLCRPRPEALRSSWSSFGGKQRKGSRTASAHEKCRGKQVPTEFRSSSSLSSFGSLRRFSTGVGCTCSPRQKRMGSTCRPRNYGCGLYLEPTQTKDYLC
jgi:hypothetical protein